MSEKDGGPAFPVMEPLEQYDEERGGYLTIYQPTGGMSLRDYFAAKALSGLCARHDYEYVQSFAKKAYEIADAMLKAREAK